MSSYARPTTRPDLKGAFWIPKDIISLWHTSFLPSVPIAVNGSYFGQGRGSTWLGGLECIGTEGTILDCLTVDQQRNVWRPLQCSSRASVVCLGKCVHGSEVERQGKANRSTTPRTPLSELGFEPTTLCSVGERSTN